MDVYDLNLVSTTREVVYRKTKNAHIPNSAVVYGGLYYDMNEKRCGMNHLRITYRNWEPG
jgi:hypothetical protein